ncbi:MAG: universal stress protein [Chromatiaceae bacterium]|nr:universal stress protein [Chromatiaceae bacterium]MCP5447684.1 universal stress protein [Chromatiaceae bacterium]
MGVQILEYDTPVATGSIMLTLSIENAAADDHALSYGARLAARMKRDLLIVHAVHEPGDKPGLYRQLDQQMMHVPLRDLALNICRQRIEDLYSRQPELKPLESPALIVIPGLPATRILQIAKAMLPCCIVMQKNHPTVLGKLLRTSITDNVVKHSLCPVVLIDSGVGNTALDSLLLEISHLSANSHASPKGSTPLHIPV